MAHSIALVASLTLLLLSSFNPSLFTEGIGKLKSSKSAPPPHGTVGVVSRGYDELPECDVEYDFNHHPRTCVPKAILKCASGYMLVAGSCLRTVYAEQIVKCPSGSELTNGECVTLLSTEPSAVCPPGHHPSGRKGVCERLEVVTAEVLCDGGFKHVKGHCTKSVSKPPTTRCPAKHRLTHSGCVKETRVRAVEHCPIGYELSRLNKHSDECVKTITVPAAIGCDKDYVLHHTECVKVQSVKIHHSCEKGFKQDGRFCIRQLQSSAELHCPPGYKVKLSACEAVTTAEAFPVCPKGYDAQRDLCVREHKHAPSVVCPKSTKLIENECVTYNYAAVELVCPPGTWLRGGHYCVSTETMPPEMKCPHRYTEANNHCEKYDKKPFKHQCPKGYGVAPDEGGVCSRIQRYKADTVCNGHKTVGMKCESVEEVPAEQVCGRGELNEVGECVTVDTVNAEGFCRKGFTIGAHKSQCERRVLAGTESICPKGSEFKLGKCALCTSHPPEITCPKKYQVTPEGGCSQTVTMKPLYGCPQGYVFAKGMCFPKVQTQVGGEGHGGLLHAHGTKGGNLKKTKTTLHGGRK